MPVSVGETGWIGQGCRWPEAKTEGEHGRESESSASQQRHNESRFVLPPQRVHGAAVSESRQREIEQGLREPSGALIGGLDILDYNQGLTDYQDGNPSPRITSTSYDLGRELGRRREEETAAMLAKIKADQDRSRAAMRDMIKHRPDLLADYDAKMAELDRKYP